ncbi:hypothetical protein D3C75_660000 [compost metagenome]
MLRETGCIVAAGWIQYAVAIVSAKQCVVRSYIPQSGLFLEIGGVIIFTVIYIFRNDTFAVNDVVVLAFDTPVNQHLALVGSQVIQEFNCTHRIFSIYADPDSVASHEACRPEGSILILLRQGHRKVCIPLVQLAFGFQCSFSVSVTPVLVNQTNDTTRSNFGFVLVILLNKAFRIKQTDVVHMVEPAEIFFLGRTAEVIGHFLRININRIFSIIRGTCSNECRVGHCNVHVPIICIQGQTDVFVAVLIGWMFFKVSLDDVFIILNSLDFRITGFFDGTVLKFKSAARIKIFVIHTCIGRNSINRMIIITVA